MNYFIQKISRYLNNKDEWIFIALAITYSLWQLSVNDWFTYLQLFLINTLCLLPIISFKSFQPKMKGMLTHFRYRLLWFFVFLVYPLVMFDSQGYLFLIAVTLELLLMANYSFKHVEPIKVGLNKIGIDGAILAFLMFISIYIGLLITSDLPGWIKANSIQSTIDFTLVGQNFLTFLSISVQMFCLFFCGFIFYWLNRHILVNKVLAQRGMFVYLLALIAAVVFLYPVITAFFLWLPINYMGEPLTPSVTANPFDWHNGRVIFAVMLLSLPVILMTQWHQKNNQLTELEKENIQTELSLLKQQIDPHFLFNTLNNLYALCRKKSNLAPDVVLQLAELMRYVVYRGKESYVLCSEEVKYIEDYISLQSIRLHNHLSLNVDINIDDPQAKISPLLLIILVENAFKHGIEPSAGDCSLSINLQVTTKMLIFTCENSVEDESSTTELKHSIVRSGVGLDNLQRRLDLLYFDKHQLTLQPSNNSFMATLKILL
jgi:sensor histidine kinase YesM